MVVKNYRAEKLALYFPEPVIHCPSKKKGNLRYVQTNQTQPVLDILPWEWHFPLSNSPLTYAQTKLNFARRSKFILLLLPENVSFFPSSVERPYGPMTSQAQRRRALMTLMVGSYWILSLAATLITKNSCQPTDVRPDSIDTTEYPTNPNNIVLRPSNPDLSFTWHKFFFRSSDLRAKNLALGESRTDLVQSGSTNLPEKTFHFPAWGSHTDCP